ncbi:MAG: MFS transporter [Candidatus Hydrogenedens sp.]|nr:MFS transporter [Candidatus Hydrogenedens sp.]
MEHAEPIVYRYRWAVLVVFALLNIMLQVHWVAFAPITKEAAAFYGVEPLSIAFLALLFLLLYVVAGLPASYVLDTFGLRWGIGLGAVLMATCGVVKGIWPSNYTAIVVAQTGLALAQPFILNAYTRLSSQWFPAREHATATGLAALSQYVGFIVAMGLTPPLLHALGMGGMLQVYGAATVVSVAAFLLVFREHPPTPPSHFDEDPRLGVWAGVKHIFRQPQMVLLLYIFLIGIGVFNALSTWIEEILAPRGFTAAQAGVAGAVMMAGGILGALVVPPLSDRIGRRVPFLVGCTALAVPGLAGFTFVTGFAALLVASFVLGFAILSAGPIGFEYGAELAHPAPESTSQGLLMIGGQISGIVFIFGMDALRQGTGTMTPFLVGFIVLTLLNALLGLRLREVHTD